MRRRPAIEDPTRAANPEPEEAQEPRSISNPVLLARWVLVLTICYVVVLGTDSSFIQLRNLFIGALLTANLFGIWALQNTKSWPIRWIVTLVDVLFVSLAILAVGNATTDFFFAYFLVLGFAVASVGVLEAGAVSFIISVVYGLLLHYELGPMIWLDRQYLMRMAFLFAAGFFFGVIADEAKRQKHKARALASRMQSVASHAKILARDKYRLRALSEIGRLGLAGSGAAGNDVLFEISKRLQKGVGVDRCSLVFFSGEGEHTGYVAASSDDDTIEVRMLDVDKYPELQATMASGEITEVHPRRPPELWKRIREFLPNVSRFNSFLVVPIKADDRVFGAFYLRDHDPQRQFNAEERDFCWASAMMTASFIHGRDLLEQLREQSRVDGLTGLLNFQAFTEEAHRILGAPGARKRAPYSLVVLDLDNLKEINDRHGHVAGNRAIIELGNHMQEAFPEALAMCRYGGDEFVALVRRPLKSVVADIETMLHGLTELDWGAPFDVRASVGVAEFPEHGDTAESLLEAADQAMYLAKGSGGHQVRSADGNADKGEIYEAVVAVQTKRIVPNVMETFNSTLDCLQRRAILGLRAPVVRQSIAALMDAVESLDPLSRAHSVGVSDLCRSLAAHMGMAEDDVLVIEIAGYLHDVGKIKLPPEILTKRGPLSEEERAAIQKAPEAGAEIVAALPGLDRVARLIRAYQERWDGSGYPEGLEGDAIPRGAQIVGICDVYNALVSPRSQRPALEPHVARKFIEKEIGRLWDPGIARGFLEMLVQVGPAAANSTRAAVGDPEPHAREDRRQIA